MGKQLKDRGTDKGLARPNSRLYLSLAPDSASTCDDHATAIVETTDTDMTGGHQKPSQHNATCRNIRHCNSSSYLQS
eukprot:8911763-Lingulodinium_polyedra.AAC.1